LRCGLRGLRCAHLHIACNLGDVGDGQVYLLNRRALLLCTQFNLARGFGRGLHVALDAFERGRHVGEIACAGVHRLRSGFGRHDGGVDGGAHVLDHATRLARRAGDAVGELADFVGHDAKSLAGFARAGGLDVGVDGENVGLLGKLGDDIDQASNLLRFAPQVKHVVDDLVHLAANAVERSLRAVDARVAQSRGFGCFTAEGSHALGAVGNLARGGQQFGHRSRDLAHSGCLLARAGRLLGRG
jgi:hypothetical protein